MTPVRAILGDSREVLRTLDADSIDSCVTDPPYALVSISKRFGKDGAAPAKSNGATGVYARAASGFMGQKWDTGETAFDPAFWAEVLRVLKPGAHVLAFGGTRTYHRLACAIEDAGFEIRDAVLWHYGSGFPKSHDVSRGIDRARNSGLPDVSRVCNWIADRCDVLGISRKALGAASGTSDMGGWWASRLIHRSAIPTLEQWQKLEPLLGAPPEWMLSLLLPANAPGEAWDLREIVGNKRAAIALPGMSVPEAQKHIDITAPATEAARQWAGWGTAIKPATEIICLARKPLSDATIAANVLHWGTGALNIDGCRVATGESLNGGSYGNTSQDVDQFFTGKKPGGGGGVFAQPTGRWPANLIHDGSDEVLAGFPETASSTGVNKAGEGGQFGTAIYGDSNGRSEESRRGLGDSGSAARFFYCAKSDSNDRAGSRHPTIKPVALISYLIRLVTPRGGTTLDPFAGSGTTGEAAMREGCKAILIEREPAYFEDIERRMKLALAGPEERARAIIKASGKAEYDAGPLFTSEAAE